MKKYFLHNGTESSGPFDFDELKTKKISKKIAVWFEGMENWKRAEEIDELAPLFIPTPPPLQPMRNSDPIIPIKNETESSKIIGLSKNNFSIVCGLISLVIATVVFNNYQENRNKELELKNHKTEVENHQYELQQKEIEEQKIALEEQAKKEAERNAQMSKQMHSDRIIEIEKLLAINNSNIEAAKEKLNDVSGFKFLRSAEEKAKQIDLLQKEIRSYTIEIEKLNSESYQLQLELEKMK